MSWYAKRGDTSQEDFKKKGSRPDVFRFWLENGTSRDVVFLDDQGFGIWEHVVKVGDDYHNVTCRMDGCMLCNHPDKKFRYKSYVECYNVFDLQPYEKDGKKFPGSRRLLAVKGEAQQKALARRRDAAGGTLVGKKVNISRDGDKSPASGSDFNVVGEFDLTKLPEKMRPYELEKVLAPLGDKDLEYLLKAKTGNFSDTESVSTTSSPEDDSDIPF